MCTDTVYILDLILNIFNVTHALTTGFNVMQEQESLVLQINETIMKIEKYLDHGNGKSC